MITCASANRTNTCTIINMVLCINVSVYIGIATVTGVSGISALSTSRRSYNRFIAMTICGNEIVNIRITTVTSVGGVTLILASRLGHNCRIAVISRGNSLGFKFTTGAYALLLALLGAGGFLGCFPIAEAVSNCRYIVINIRITTVAGIGRITLILTSRLGYNRLIAMIGRRDNLGFIYAASALTLLLALFGAGGFLCGLPITEAVSGSRYVIINVRITASASVGGVAL